MASTDELEAEILAEMEANPEAYADVSPINDTITIDPETRTVNLPASETLFGTEQEMDVERKYFKCPRIVGDNIDLSKHQIYIMYITAKDSSGTFLPEEGAQPYYCEDMAVDETGDYITFSWLLSGNVLSKPGFIAFAVVAKRMDGEVLKTRWKTKPAVGTVLLTVPDGASQIADAYPDIIVQLLDRMNEVEAIASEEAMQGYVEKYLGEHPVQIDDTLTDNTKAAPAGIVGELKSDLNNQTTFADDVHLNGNKTYSIGRYVNKSVKDNGDLSNDTPIRASTLDLYYIPINATVLTNANTGYLIWMYYYDEHKNFLSSVFSSEARYFRACVVRDDNGNITTEEAKSNASFVCSYDVPQMPTKISQLDNDENYAKKTDIPTLYYTEHTVNIYDKSKRTAGYMSGKDTIDSSNTAYDTSGFISVEKGTYVFQMSTNTADIGRMTYTTYDRNKQPLTFKNMTNVHFVAISMESDGYIKVCTYNSMMGGKAMVLKGTEPLTEFVSFKEWETIDSKAVADNPLYGKKWCVLGDSFTNGATGNTLENGRYKGEKKVYPYFIGNRQNMDIVSFFAGGRTLSYPEVSNGFVNSITCPTAECYYQNIPEDADYITIYLGINDSHHRSSSSGGDGEDNTGIIPIGTIDDITVYTYYGAWNVVLTWLLENRPFAHIGIIVSNGCDTAEYRIAQLDIAKKYGIPYIDLNGDERTPTMIRSQNPNISQAVKNIVDKKQAVDYDGSKTGSVNLHPNDYAHEYESYFIENFLRSI